MCMESEVYCEQLYVESCGVVHAKTLVYVDFKMGYVVT